jgi:hypothetical protein
MSGFGSQPFGTGPYGLGTPATATSIGGSILRDTTTGESLGSRQIDPLTKDYVLDDNGRLLGMSDVKQLVLIAVSTTKGSSAMRELGHELRSIDRITANFAARVRNTLLAAVQHIVDRRLIEVLDVVVELVRPGVAKVRLRWRDVSTQNEETTEV